MNSRIGWKKIARLRKVIRGGNSPRFVLGHYTLTRAIEHIDGRVWGPRLKPGENVIDARACVYALHRARPSEHYTAACPGLLHSIRDIPHSSHTCTNASVEVPRIPVVDTQASRHDTDADAAPFMGQGNIRTVYGTGESSAFCAVGSTLLWKSRFPAPFLRRIERSALRYFALLPLGEREVLLEEER